MENNYWNIIHELLVITLFYKENKLKSHYILKKLKGKIYFLI